MASSLSQRVLGTVMGDTFPNHNNTSEYGNPTSYYIGTLDPLGLNERPLPGPRNGTFRKLGGTLFWGHNPFRVLY